MAVQAGHLCFFPPQILTNNREIVINGIEGNGNMCVGPMEYGFVPGTTATNALIPPMYETTMTDLIPVKTALKSDSGITHSLPVVSRKRSRDACAGAGAGITNNPLMSSFPANQQNDASTTFLGENISFLTHQNQLEIDQIVAQNTAKLRMEMEEKRKSYSRRIIMAVEETITKKLRAKDEEIENIGKLNLALEEKIKSLCAEIQIWKELAQSNEATANSLRNNLEHVLTQQQNSALAALPAAGAASGGGGGDAEAGLLDDAQSCCGSNFEIVEEEEAERRRWNSGENIGGGTMDNAEGTTTRYESSRWRMCRNCWKDMASVLILPCRHLCLCSGCGSDLKACPVCLCTKNATIHINFSHS